MYAWGSFLLISPPVISMNTQSDPTADTQSLQHTAELWCRRAGPSVKVQEWRMCKFPSLDSRSQGWRWLDPLFIRYRKHRFLPYVLATEILSSALWERSVHLSADSCCSALAMPSSSDHRHISTLQSIIPPNVLSDLTWDSGHIFQHITQQALGGCNPVS